MQLWEQQKQLEEQRREKERLEALRKKDKHDHSAIASTEVKQRLQVLRCRAGVDRFGSIAIVRGARKSVGRRVSILS